MFFNEVTLQGETQPFANCQNLGIVPMKMFHAQHTKCLVERMRYYFQDSEEISGSFVALRLFQIPFH